MYDVCSLCRVQWCAWQGHLVHVEQLVVHEDLELKRLRHGLAEIGLRRITAEVLRRYLHPLQSHLASTSILILHERLRVADFLCLCLLEEGGGLLQSDVRTVEVRVHGEVLEACGSLDSDL
jgi:hypothetical protein